MSDEIQWKSGKESYTPSEIEFMLQTQRAMVYNDVNSLIQEICELRSEVGKMNEDELKIMGIIRNCRKVQI